MAKLYKRKDGRYSAQVFVGIVDGKRKYRTVYGETQSEVRQKASLIEADVFRGLYTQDEEMDETDAISDLTVGQLLLDWLESVDGVKINTKISYEGIVRNHLIPKLGSIKLQELKPIDVQAMLNDLKKMVSPPERGVTFSLFYEWHSSTHVYYNYLKAIQLSI